MTEKQGTSIWSQTVSPFLRKRNSVEWESLLPRGAGWELQMWLPKPWTIECDPDEGAEQMGTEPEIQGDTTSEIKVLKVLSVPTLKSKIVPSKKARVWNFIE